MSDLETRSQLYAWLGDRTSQPDGDAWDHDHLRVAAVDLANLVATLAFARAGAGEQQREQVAEALEDAAGHIARSRRSPQEIAEYLRALARIERATPVADTPPCPSTLTVTEDGITAVVHCLAGPGHEQHANQGRTW